MKISPALSIFMCLAIFNPFAALCQETNYSPEFVASVRRMHELTSTPAAYKNAALQVLVAEASKVAGDLALDEDLPITEAKLTASYITPPKMAEQIGAVGNITTAKYTYFFSVGGRFSYLTKVGLQEDYAKMRKENLVSKSLMDTNAAYQAAVNILEKASMNVKQLNQDCHVHIMAFNPEGDSGEMFVPVYWVYWTLPEQEGHGSTASVELFMPNKVIRQLRVEDSKYILRKPLVITNLDYLLSQTNTPPATNAPPKP
jgi:hypothetical protein